MAYANTIINNIKSNGKSPYAYYTVTAEATRINATAITVNVNVAANLASSSSSLGTGSTMGLDSYFNFNGQTKGALRIKATNTSWSGTTKHYKTGSYTVDNVSATTSSIGTCFRTTRTGSVANTTNTSYGCWTSWRGGSALPIPIWVYYSYNANGGTTTPTGGSFQGGNTVTLAAAISHNNTTANGYTVTFDANGGSVSPTTATATDTTSYSFAGWLCSLNGTTYSAGATSPALTADTTFTAQWTTSTTKGSIATPSATHASGTATRTVTFNANGGSTTKTSQNSTATITYTANGWYTATSGGTKRCNNGASYTPSASETVHQQWGSSTGSYSAVTLPTTSQCTRTYYTLLGFSTSDTATTATYSPGASYTPDATRTLYAVWQLNAPTAATISITNITRSKVSVSVGYTGTGLTGYTVYYRANSTGTYSSVSLGTSSTGTITGLQPNTSYQFYVKATNSSGSIDSSTTTSTTKAYTPIVNLPTSTNLTSSSSTIGVSATGDTNAAITNYTLYWTPVSNIQWTCTNAQIIDDMAFKVLSSDNSVWVRLFYHNCKEGTVLFTSLNECKNTQTTDKYSRLYLIDSGDLYKSSSDNKYEFMLCYPNNTTQYNRWKQTYAPQNEFVTETSTGDGVATGYSAVHIDWTSNYWGGMTRDKNDTSSYSPTWLSGSVGHANWFYAIGAASTHGDGIPSYSSTFSCVELWVRIGTLTNNASSQNMNTSTSTSITNLTENTDYIIWTSATNAGGTMFSPALTIHTLSGQVTLQIKNNGAWVEGPVYVKVNGAWVAAEKVFIKNNGTWVESTN